MESEKTKRLTSLYLGGISLILGAMPLVLEKITQAIGVPEWVHYEYQDFEVLFWVTAIVVGILAIVTGCSSKFVVSVVLGSIGILFSVLSFLGVLYLSLLTITTGKDPCFEEMKTLSSAAQKYCEQNEGTLPNADVWCDQLLKSVENDESFSIETFSGSVGLSRNPGKDRSTFAFNKNLDEQRLADIDRQTVLLFETNLGWNQNGTSAILRPEGHWGLWPLIDSGYHFVLVGPGTTFTVKFVKYSNLDSLNWTAQKEN